VSTFISESTSRVRFIRAITIIAATFAPSATGVSSQPEQEHAESEPNVTPRP